jgi:hypothetical protein
MGKSCIRYKKLDDLALDVIAEAIRRVPARTYIAHCEAALKAVKKSGASDSGKAGDPEKPLAAGKSPAPARKKPRSGK